MRVQSKWKQLLGCYSNEKVRGNVDSDNGAPWPSACVSTCSLSSHEQCSLEP